MGVLGKALFLGRGVGHRVPRSPQWEGGELDMSLVWSPDSELGPRDILILPLVN